LEIQVKDPNSFSEPDFRSKYSLNEDDFSFSVIEGILHIQFNKNKVGIQEIINDVLASTEILDMSIFETKIEDIIKKIYRNEVTIG
jgi:ABC-type uncharacterized transport system ATPase subunit